MKTFLRRWGKAILQVACAIILGIGLAIAAVFLVGKAQAAELEVNLLTYCYIHRGGQI